MIRGRLLPFLAGLVIILLILTGIYIAVTNIRVAIAAHSLWLRWRCCCRTWPATCGDDRDLDQALGRCQFRISGRSSRCSTTYRLCSRSFS